MPKVARVIITTDCNLKCKYCCNRIPEVQQTFKMTTVQDFIDMSHKYEVINFTGGEPLLAQDKLVHLLTNIPRDIKRYLYTNGTQSPWTDLLEELDGVNVSIHNTEQVIKYLAFAGYAWCSNHKWRLKSRRLWVEDKKITEEITTWCKEQGWGLVPWTMNVCGKTEEDRWIL